MRILEGLHTLKDWLVSTLTYCEGRRLEGVTVQVNDRKYVQKKGAPVTDIATNERSIVTSTILTQLTQRTIRFGCKRREVRVIRDDDNDDRFDNVVFVRVPDKEPLMEVMNPGLAYA